MAATQQYSLRWNNYFRHLTYSLDNHRNNCDFVDVSLCCDGRKIKAHKVVLSSCSGYFKEIFKENPHPHPVIIFKFIKFEDLNSIIEFMYQGEVNVQQEALQSFLQTAELLAVQGLTAEEKEKPKAPPAPTQIMEDPKFIKTIPSTIRAFNEVNLQQQQQQTPTQTIGIPTTLLPATTHQHQHPQTVAVTLGGGGQSQQQQQLQTPQIQQIQIQQVHQQQQQQQTQLHQVSTSAGGPMVSIPTQIINTGSGGQTNSSNKKRKITFSDDDDNIYATESVDFVKDEPTIVKTADMAFLRGTVKIDMPEYIVTEVDDSQTLSDGGNVTDSGGSLGHQQQQQHQQEQQQSNQDGSATSGGNVGSGPQNITQFTSEYEILTESEIEDKFNTGDDGNSEIMEMVLTPTGRIISASAPNTSSNNNNNGAQMEDASHLEGGTGTGQGPSSSGGGTGLLSSSATKAGESNKNSSTESPRASSNAKDSSPIADNGRSNNSSPEAGAKRKHLLDGTGYSCISCNRRLKNVNAYRRHMYSKHVGKDAKHSFECPHCQKKFKTKWSLSTHNSRFHRNLKAAKEVLKLKMT